MSGRIRVGIGGWTYPPWRGSFYPAGLPHAQELAYAATHLTSIEINATFHRTQTPNSFGQWRAAVPEDFLFALKAPRFATWRHDLAEAGPSISRFLDSGIAELGTALGPILWQFPPTRRFDPAMVEPFLDLLPPAHLGMTLRHAIETPHESFADPGFAALLRARSIAWAMVDADGYPAAEPTAAFVYARLKRSAVAEPEGYATQALDRCHARLWAWAAEGRDCFVYLIAGEKVRAPVAALAMLRRLAADAEAVPATRASRRRRVAGARRRP